MFDDKNGIKRYPVILYFKGYIKDASTEYLYGKVEIGTSSKPIDYQTLVESVNMDKFKELFDSMDMFGSIELVTKEEYEANKDE